MSREPAASASGAEGILGWFARNHVASNLLMIGLIAAGLGTLASGIKQEVFPEFSADVITVTVPYLGAAPEEVEQAVCARIEERIQDLEGIKELRSTASEGQGRVVAEVEPGYDLQELLDNIKTRVDAIDTFPEETEKPIIQEVIVRRQVITVAVHGPAEVLTLRHLAERVRDDLAALPAISQVELAAARPYEISIEISEDDLRRWGLTFDQVATAVRRSSLDLPGGSLRTEGGEILLRTVGQAYRGDAFEQIVLLTRPDGTRLLLGEVATVVDGFAETDQSARFDGEPAVLVDIYRVGDQSALEIADAVKGYVAEAAPRIPAGIQLTTWRDDTEVLRSRLDLLLKNGAYGLILVLLVLTLFLRLRLAFWVSLGIPISFLGTLWLMPSLDVSINLISLFAFLVVLGIVVDDAIVVGENIHRHFQDGKEPMRAAIDGVKEVAVPVTFSILTTVAAFAPLLMVQGNTGKIMKVIPTVVIATLFFSLVESLFVLPSHLGHSKMSGRGDGGREGERVGWGRRFQRAFAAGVERVIEGGYRPTLAFAARWRYACLAAGLVLLLLSLGMVLGGRLQFTFFPKVEADNVAAMLTMPLGTPAAVTAQAVERIEAQALALKDQLEREGHKGTFRHVLTSVGEQPFAASQQRGGFAAAFGPNAAHLGEVAVELSSAEVRTITSPEITDRWRRMVGGIPDATELTFTSSLFSTGEPVNIQLAGSNLEALESAAVRIKEALRQYPGVKDIADSFDAGKKEIKLAVTAEAQTLGLTLSDLGRQVRQGFYGEEAQRIQRGRDEIRVMVRYPEHQRTSLGDLETMRVRTPDGGEVPFSVVGKAQLGRGFAAIQRSDRSRTLNITADVDALEGNANVILADVEARVLPEILADYPGLRYSLEGEQQEQRETLGGLKQGFLFAMLLIYGLLAVPFRSYFQPLIVMSVIPFGLIGAIWGHIVLGQDLTVLSMFGIVALTGVVVNDSLVMVDFINRAYRGGMPLIQAVMESGARRFRPILLTSLTTFVGLSPLLLEKSLQAQFLIPMAISLAFGVLFATFITLILVPLIYIVLEDVKRLFGFQPAAREGAEAGEMEEGAVV